MANENKVLLWTVLAVAVVVLLFNGYMLMNQPQEVNEQAIVDAVTQSVVANLPTAAEAPQIPTAEEIASAIKVDIPEPVLDSRIDDIWESEYSAEIEELEDAAEDNVLAEFEDDDYEALEDFLKANVEGFDELTDVDVEDTEVKVIRLGLGEDEDKVAEVLLEVDVEYVLQEGMVAEFKDTVLVKGTVVYDEGDFDEEDVELVFTLA